MFPAEADDKPYACSHCSRRCGDVGSLKEHMRTHTGERPFKCEICGRPFSTSGSRRRHERLVHGTVLTSKKYRNGQETDSADMNPNRAGSMKLTGQYLCLVCNIELTSIEAILKHHRTAHSSDEQTDQKSTNLASRHAPEREASDQSLAIDVVDVSDSHSQGKETPKKSTHCIETRRKTLLKSKDTPLAGKLTNNDHKQVYVCRFCSKEFCRLPYFQKHMLQHSEAETMPCDVKIECESEEPADIEAVKSENAVENEASANLWYSDGKTVDYSQDVVLHEVKDEHATALLHLTASEEVFQDMSNIQEFAAHENNNGSNGQDWQREEGQKKSLSRGKKRKKKSIQNERTKRMAVRRVSAQRLSYPASDQSDSLGENCQAVSSGERTASDEAATGSSVAEEVVSSNGRLVSCAKCGIKLTLSDDYCDDDDGEKTFMCDTCYVVSCLNNTKEVDETKDVTFKSEGECNQMTDRAGDTSDTFELDKIQMPFSCTVCNRSFAFKYRLQRHMLHHTGEKPFKCNECGKAFTTNAYLGAHVALHKNEWKYSCSICEKFFCHRIAWRNHKRLHEKKERARHGSSTGHTCCNGDGERICSCGDGCNKCYKKAENKPRKEKVFYTCTLCNRQFQSKFRLQRHGLHHTGEKPYKCDECGKAFTTNAYLGSHMARHSNVLSHLCSICGKSFADRIAWRGHMRCHAGRKKPMMKPSKMEHICWICGAKLSTASGLTRHLRSHGIGEKFYKCDECGLLFRTMEGFKYHVGRHAPEKPYHCMDCPKVFADAWSLKFHSKTHAKGGSFECNVCSKKFTALYSLKVHGKRHLDMRYSCEYCGETFGFARKFRSHLISHRPPCSCENCGTTFTRLQGLRKHQRRFKNSGCKQRM